MAKNFKILGQSAPDATTDTNVYTVPASTESVISTITVANRGSTATSYRIALRPNGTSIANTHYIAYDVPLAGNDTSALTLGITLDASDVITVYAGNANLTFSVFGSEIS